MNPVTRAVLWVTTLAALHLVCGIGASCPSSEAILPCICANRSQDLQIWCTHSDLPQVAKGLQRAGNTLKKHIDELIIENNYLPSLPGKIFLNVKVLRLMLRHNGLERLSQGWLDAQERNIMEIFIVENDLKSIPSESLSKLESLQAITIQSNELRKIPSFSSLPLLKYISIQSSSVSVLNEEHFMNLPSLEKIYIQGSTNLQKINEKVFYNLPKLKRLDITRCGITDIHMRALSLLPMLTDLSLEGNKLTDAAMVGQAMRELQHLTTLNLSGNEIESLNEASFVELPTLQRLLLSNNKISEIHYGAFHRVPQLRIVDMNNNRINRIHPESFLQQSGHGIEELSLIGNRIMHISEFKSLLDGLPRLKFLDFSDNLLEEIPRGALRGHPSLERLHLNQNKIKYIDIDAFVAMPALRELRLRNNSLNDLNEGPYWNLPALKGLDLSNNYFYRLQPKLLYNLPALRRVDFSSNRLTMIDPITFLESPFLEYVNISGNALVSIHPATFRNLRNLYELDASANRLVEFVPGLPRGLENLYLQKNQISSLPAPPSPDIDLPSLRKLDISSNGIQRIPYGTMKMLPGLMRLYLRRNGLRQIEEDTFSELERLEILDIGDNQIISIHPKGFARLPRLIQVNLHGNLLENFDFNSLEGNYALSKLDFSKNKLKKLADHIIKRPIDIEFLNISSNSLIEFPPTMSVLSKLKILDATKNHIKILDGNILEKIHSLVELKMPYNKLVELRPGTFNNIKELEIINLENNQIESLHPRAIRMLPSLHSLYLGWNHIIDLPDEAFSDLPQLRVLELQGNRLQGISATAFNQLPLVQFLNLSHNLLESLEYSGLRQLASLEVLDLSFNKLTKMSSSTFEYMNWLVELHLDHNKLCYISGKPFDYMPRIKILSMRNNRLTSVAEPTFAKLKNNIAIFDIDGNPLVCNCRIIWLKTWLQESYSIGPKCADGTFIKQIPFTQKDCQNKPIDIEPLASCETHDNEALSPSLGTSQVFSPWDSKMKDHPALLSNNKVNRIPTPEESEYFYDEYVDYPYNETAVLAGLGDVNLSNFSLNQSHHIPGDTPTLYAGSSNSSKNNQDSSSTQPNSGFTFFGVPLPSLDMGKLWNTGRKLDWPSNNRSFKSMSKYPKYQYEEPKFETGGFEPMLPTTAGGFRPIMDPTLTTKMTVNSSSKIDSTIIQPNSQNKRLQSSTTKSILMTQPYTSTAKTPLVSTKFTNDSKSVTKEMHENIAISTMDNKTKIIYNKTKTIQQNRNDQTMQTDFKYTENNVTISDDNEKDDDNSVLITTDTSNDMSIPSWMETSTASYTYPGPSSTKSPPYRDTTPKDSPTALSAILAPSNANSDMNSKRHFNNRPATITKVKLPNLKPFDSEGSYLPVNNREGKTSFGDHNTDNNVRRNYADRNMDWYYMNYNKSNLEPYVAPGVLKSGAPALQWLFSRPAYVFFVLPTFIDILYLS